MLRYFTGKLRSVTGKLLLNHGAKTEESRLTGHLKNAHFFRKYGKGKCCFLT